MLKVKVIWLFYGESLELLLTNLLHIPDSLSCSKTCHFLLCQGQTYTCFLPQRGCQALLFRGQGSGHPWRKRSAHLVSDHDDVCPLASHNVGGHLGTLIMALATSGSAIIQRSRVLGLSVTPTAPPSPLINALFCSCAWSIGSKRTRYSYSVQ